jgi:hypothetical protein
MMMKRRSFIGAMLAAAMAPAFVKAESLMKVAAPTGWTTSEGGILVQETSEGGFLLPRFVSIDLYRELVDPVADPAGKDNVLIHPKLAERLFTGEVGRCEGYTIVRSELERFQTPAGKRLLMAMRDAQRV